MHGLKKLHWTKLAETLSGNVDSKNTDVRIVRLIDDVTSWKPGIKSG